MKILWIATKAPWPPVDGGRRVCFDTLNALASAGHEVDLVAPVAGSSSAPAAELRELCRPHLVAIRPTPTIVDGCRAQLTGKPVTIVRHSHGRVRRRVARLLAGGRFDLIQVEQVQALSSVPGPAARLPPVVLRAQNVESDLWSQAARDGGWRRSVLALEARRLARWEGLAVRRSAATLTLTVQDAARLADLSGAADKISAVPAPFATELEAAAERLPGEPPIVLFGSAGWHPNARGADWFLQRAWPRVREALPGAALHVFGLSASAPGVVSHQAPTESRAAYPRGAILAVPLQIASGVRIKILEAWARGVPVVATPAAAQGLGAEDGQHLLLADDGEGFARAFARLDGEDDLAARLIAGGRRRLREHHEPSRVARRLAEIYAPLTRSFLAPDFDPHPEA
ncbi:MAG: glycosyltransferase [bacterium]|nr:glycosyltransferase [bacterium]